jgi:hypothetical protein
VATRWAIPRFCPFPSDSAEVPLPGHPGRGGQEILLFRKAPQAIDQQWLRERLSAVFDNGTLGAEWRLETPASVVSPAARCYLLHAGSRRYLVTASHAPLFDDHESAVFNRGKAHDVLSILHSDAWISILPLAREKENLAGIVRTDDEAAFDELPCKIALALQEHCTAAWFAASGRLAIADERLWNLLAEPSVYVPHRAEGPILSLHNAIRAGSFKDQRSALLGRNWAAAIAPIMSGRPFRVLCRIPAATAAAIHEELWFDTVRIKGLPGREARLVGSAGSDSVLDQSLMAGEYRVISIDDAIQIEGSEG